MTAPPLSEQDLADMVAILRSRDLSIAEFHAMQLRVADTIEASARERLTLAARAERAEADLAAAKAQTERDVRATVEMTGRLQKLEQDLAAARADAERYRWLRDQRDDDGCVIVMKNKHFVDDLSCEANIDRYIDSAIAASRKESEG